MAATQVKCPSCATLLQLAALPPDGGGIRCPRCGQVFRVAAPTPPAAPKPAAKAPPASPPAPRSVKPAPTAPPSAAKANNKVAPRPAPAAKPVAVPLAKSPAKPAKPVAVPLAKSPAKPAKDDDHDEKPRRKRPVIDDGDEDDAPPARSAPKKSGKGKVFLAAVIVLFLLCGGAVGGSYWAVKAFFGAASDALAQATGKLPAPDNSGEPKPPDTTPVAEKPADNGLDVRYVAPDFVAGFVVNAPHLLDSPVVKSVLKDEQLDAVKKEVGVDPRKLERAILLAEAHPGSDPPFYPAVILRFSGPVNGTLILSKVLRDLREESAEGQSLLVSNREKWDGEIAMAGHVADERTVILAPEPILHKMLASKGDGPLARQMRRTDLKSDIAAAFVLGPVRKEVDGAMKDIKEKLPPEFADAATAHEHLRGGRAAVNLTGETLLALTLEADDDDSAASLEKLLGRGTDTLRRAYPDIRKEWAKSLPSDVAKDVLAAVDRIPESVGISRSKNEVTLTLKSPGDLSALAPKVVPFLMNRGGSEKPPEPPPPPPPAEPQEDSEFEAYGRFK
jgi:predicted Zn finger-like uncharacterized protein